MTGGDTINTPIILYKDGDDVVVVFKKPTEDIKALLQNNLFSKRDIVIKEVPELEPSITSSEEIAYAYTRGKSPKAVIQEEKFDGFIKLLVGIQAEAFEKSQISDVLVACKEFFEAHNKVQADKVGTFNVARLKNFLMHSYRLNEDLTTAYYESDCESIAVFVDSLSETELRSAAEVIGKIILSFFE